MLNHRWDISPTEAIELQKVLARQVIVRPLAGAVRTVAGTDCAFLAGGSRVLAGAVLCDARSMEVVESAYVVMPCAMAYIPGLLSFREAPAVIAAVGKLRRRPDLLMCDGQGLAHPRGLGLASHVGLYLGMAAIGVAKSRLCGTHRAPGLRRGCRTQLRLNGQVVGAVVRTRTGVKPLYVSPGHLVSLADAVGWTLRCGRPARLPARRLSARRLPARRLPAPTRRAHQLVTSLKGKIAGEG